MHNLREETEEEEIYIYLEDPAGREREGDKEEGQQVWRKWKKEVGIFHAILPIYSSHYTYNSKWMEGKEIVINLENPEGRGDREGRPQARMEIVEGNWVVISCVCFFTYNSEIVIR